MRLETIAARGGRDVTSGNRPLTPPLYQTNVFVFDSMAQVEAVWEGKEPGFVYGRYGTPNHAMLETMVAELERGEAAVACASGMGATTALILGLLRRGDHLVAARDLYGSTTALFTDEVGRLGIEVSFVDASDPERVVEALSNPLLRVVDVEALAARLAGRGVELIVDSSLASPAVLRPMGLGASVVLHSATKFISGHGDVTAGVVVGSRAVVERVRAAAIRVGTNLSPFDCWLAARGLRTLHVRPGRQCGQALGLARVFGGGPEGGGGPY